MDIPGLVLLYLDAGIDFQTFASQFAGFAVEASQSENPELQLLYRRVDELFRQAYDDNLPVDDFHRRLTDLVAPAPSKPSPSPPR